MNMQEKINICIIGAGAIGLAIAAELASPRRRIFVLERNRTFGLETSSHNSEVIHAGIYNPPGSLKTRLCVEGRPLLYEFCEKYKIAYRRLGKIIVGANVDETREIERLYKQGKENGVNDLTFLTRAQIKRLEPNVEAVAAFLSPSTGIIDSHGLMQMFYGLAREYGADFVFNAEVIGIEKTSNGFEVAITQAGNTSTLSTTILINAAGLHSDRVAVLAGIDINKTKYRIHYCKGEYFSVSSRLRGAVSRLIYPIPEQAGTGIHICLNLESNIRLGPSAEYVNTIDYHVDETNKNDFYRAAQRYLPAIQFDDLAPDFAGIRPKLQGPGDGFRDFVIQEESAKGLPGLVNLIGIESPGLTASPAIARYVRDILKKLM
jgi:L-2-hydroxyglutarate oxidase LhgO